MDLNAAFQTFAAAQVAGQQINADLQSKREESDLRQQQLQAAKFQLSSQMQQQEQQQRFQQESQKLIAEHDSALKQQQVNSGTAPDDAAEAQLTSSIDMYQKQASAAIRSGLPSTAEQYQKLADAAQSKLSTIRKDNFAIAEKKVKSTAAFAGSVLDGSVDAQQAFAWVKDNVGLKEALAIPTDPAKAKLYWQAAQKQGVSAETQIQNQIHVAEVAEREKRLAQDHADTQEDRRIRRAELAASREANLEMRKANLELRQKQYEEGGAIQRRQTIAATNYANETARGLNLVSSLGANQTVGVFAHMQNPDTILKSLESTGTNKLTGEMEQIYQTATKGLGLELAQLATAGSGRAPVKDLINEMGTMVEARKGDTELEIMFKLANAADFAKVRLEAVPDSPDPKIQAIRKKAEEELSKFPHPSQVVALAMKKGAKLQGKARIESLREKLDRSTASEAPSDIADLLNKYK